MNPDAVQIGFYQCDGIKQFLYFDKADKVNPYKVQVGEKIIPVKSDHDWNPYEIHRSIYGNV